MIVPEKAPFIMRRITYLRLTRPVWRSGLITNVTVYLN